MRATYVVIVVCWAAFWCYWLVASRGAKPGQSRRSSITSTRVLLLVVVLILIRALGLRSHPVQRNAALTTVGLALFFLGLALAIWARLYIGSNWGAPMSRKDEPDLVTTGPYRWIRHPIYSGLILAMVGSSLAVSLWGLIATAVFSGFFVYSATREEAYLAERFPDGYPAYRRSTKMLVPFIF
jgi:protein-S-isoprenylcysteine O-methyltransferase Ste14